MPNQNNENLDQYGTSTAKEQEKQARQASSEKAAKVAAKGVATYYGGQAGGMIADKVLDSKLGKKAVHAAGKNLNRTPGAGRLAKKLDDAGALDTADQAISGLGKKGVGKIGGGQGPLPSSNGATPQPGTANQQSSTKSSKPPTIEKKPTLPEDEEKEKKDNKALGEGTFKINKVVKVVIMVGVPLLLIFIIIMLILTVVLNFFGGFGDAFGASYASGGETGGVIYEGTPEANEFYERVNNVKLSYQAQGKTVDVLKIASVYHILSTNGADVSYESMGEYEIERIADAMFSGNSYSEETFKENLKNDIFLSYFPNSTEAEREQYVEDVFRYIDDYYSFIGMGETSTCASMGSCVYEIKGFKTGKNNRVEKNLQITDLKVRLMECGGRFGSGTFGQPLEGEELVPFEQYILGVTYQEIGPDKHAEAQKAQMVAARSYSLARPTVMGNANGKKLEEENGQWILQLCSCVADQVYCNPDQGCSALNDGEQYGTVRSGTSFAKKLKEPLAQDHQLRTLATEVQGEVLVDSEGYIINAGYTQTEQTKFEQLANQGLNYKQILLQVYNSGERNLGAADVKKMSCNSGNGGACVTGPYANWKQGDPTWGSIRLGSSSHTIRSAGCLVTSISMLIAKSGVPTVLMGDFNPGTFVQFLNKNGGFIGANFVWASTSKVAPSFKHMGSVPLSGQSRAQKLSKIKEKVDEGAYVVVEVKGPTGQHWVAVDSVSGNDVIMMDPASKETIMWNRYPWGNTSQFHYYKVQG